MPLHSRFRSSYDATRMRTDGGISDWKLKKRRFLNTARFGVPHLWFASCIMMRLAAPVCIFSCLVPSGLCWGHGNQQRRHTSLTSQPQLVLQNLCFLTMMILYDFLNVAKTMICNYSIVTTAMTVIRMLAEGERSSVACGWGTLTIKSIDIH